MDSIFSKPLLATLLIAFGLGLSACSEPDEAADSTAADAGDDESTSLSIDAEDNSMSYESGDTSISVDAEGGDDQ